LSAKIHSCGAFSAREVETTTARFSTFCEDGMGAHSRKSRSEKEAHSVAQIHPACSPRRFAGDPGGSEGSTCVFKSHRRPTAELHTARLRCGQSGLSVRGDHRALFLSERSNRCRTNGSTSEPSSATKNGTRWAMRPEMKCTSRDSRSNLATGTEQCSCAIRVRGARIPGCVVHAILTFLLKNVVSRGGRDGML